MSSLADTCFDAYAASFLPRTADELTLSHVQLTFPGGSGVISVLSSRDAVAGGRSGDDEPLGLAVICDKKTALGGRQGRGRMFIPGILSTGETLLSGRLGGTSLAGFQERASNFLLRLSIGGEGTNPAPAVLLHSSSTVPPTDIDALVVNTRVGMLRKRLR